MDKRKTLITSTIGAALLAAMFGVAYSMQKPRTAWICGKKSEGANYIFKSGNEYILAYPENTYSSNSYLISSAEQKVPKRWKPENSTNIEAGDKGFEYKYSYGGGSDWKTTFNTDKGLLTDKEIASSTAPSSRKCVKVEWDAAASDNEGRLSGVPIKYLELRSRLIDLFNPKLGNKNLNVELAESLTETKNGEYGVYKMLSSLDRNSLNTDQIDTMEQSKKKLLSSSSQETTLWEHSGRLTYFPNQTTVERAREACNNASSSLSSYTSDGYEIVSSSAEEKDMGDGIKCQGTFYLLKKEGYID
jgi:hypothetical protein